MKSKRRAEHSRDRQPRLSKAKLHALIEEATLDAYGEAEQAVGLFTMIEDNLQLPFQTQVLGVEVTVEAVDITEDDQVVAVCRRGKKRQRIPILDLPLPAPPPRGAEWIAAYRSWLRGQY